MAQRIQQPNDEVPEKTAEGLRSGYQDELTVVAGSPATQNRIKVFIRPLTPDWRQCSDGSFLR